VLDAPEGVVAMAEPIAAENLEGLTLDTGWVVGKRVEKPPGSTGGFFSVCYWATKGDERCFLKAFNFAQFFHLANAHGHTTPVIDVIAQMAEAYRYERDLSALCKEKRVRKVSFVRGAGEQIVPGYAITIVPYLIFDIADGGDVRTKLKFTSKLESSWKLNSLHSVAVGLKQLHSIDVSHQDLKPSNVLLFGSETKIGDLGRSTCLTLDSPLRELPFAGEFTYAPPEILYGVHDPDWRKRSFASDCYLLGSLIVFYFTGLTMTALLRKNVPDDVSWERHRGPYEDVKAYVLDAFSKSLDEFEGCIDDESLKRSLRPLVESLCHPEVSKRTYSGIGQAGTPTDLERVVSRLNYLENRVRKTLGF
jgi:eukaryotic-like serine/threonine-protein kinase